MAETPNTVASVFARLRGWATARGWSKSRFAEAAGLPDTTLRNFHNGDWRPNTDTLQRLEAQVPPDWQVGDPVQLGAEGASATVSERASA